MSRSRLSFRFPSRWPLPGLAVLIFLVPIVCTVALSLAPKHDWPQSSPPSLLPHDAAAARLEPWQGHGVAVTEHLESVGGSLEFAPPPLSEVDRKPPPAPETPVAPEAADASTTSEPPRMSLLDKFNPTGLLRGSKPKTNPPRKDQSEPFSAERSRRRSPVPPVAQRNLVPPAPPEVTLPVPEVAAQTAAPSSTAWLSSAPSVTVPVVQPLSAGVLPPPEVPPVDAAAMPPGVPAGQALGSPADRLADRRTFVPRIAFDGTRPVTTLAAPVDRPEVVQPKTAPQSPLLPTMAAAIKPATQRSAEWQRQMWPVAIRADEQIRRGFETCGRGALFAGRGELIQALRMIAQNADAIEGGTAHSDALAAGMRAMSEAEDFAVRGSRLESELDMATLVASHRTPVVRQTLANPARAATITPLEAQNRYYMYAQQQLATATAGLPVGGIALYGLGKVHTTLAAADSDAKALEEPQAMTLYQAALLADPGNPLAAHELGVMLARHQRHAEALAMFQHSAMIASLPETWKNLATLHAQRGETDLSRRATEEAKNAEARLSRAKPASHPALARSSVRWLSPDEFAKARSASSEAIAARPGNAAGTKPPTSPAAEESKPSGVFSWLPWTTKQ